MTGPSKHRRRGPRKSAAQTAGSQTGGRPQANAKGPRGGASAAETAPAPARDVTGAPIRPERGAYFLYGFHAVRAALANETRRVGRCWATRAAAERLADALAARDIAPRAADRAVLDALLGAEAVHQGAVIEVWPLDDPGLEALAASAPPAARFLLLDQITDPHNVGAILRTAAVFGAQAVCLQARNAPPETAVLAKSASGALDHTPLVRIGNLARALDLLKEAGFWIVGLDGEAERTLADLPRAEKLAIVLGAEGEGLRRLTRERCDLLARIPMAAGPIGSLNVSNAAAVALYAALPDAPG